MENKEIYDRLIEGLDYSHERYTISFEKKIAIESRLKEWLGV